MFIEDLRALQSTGVTSNLISTLRMIEINPIEMCNRKCNFCPRSTDFYKNKKFSISKDTVKKISSDLESFNFNGRIGFVGFGEPLLHPELEELINIVKKEVTNLKWLEINTNGDFLTLERMKSIKDSGCTTIAISMYDIDKSQYFNEMAELANMNIILRHHYNSSNNYGLRIVNRNDIIDETSNFETDKTHCYIPFYKMLIDWNGDVLLCDNDWSKKNKFGNVHNMSINDIWINSELNNYRNYLSNGNRILDPCKKCNACGTLFGYESFIKFQETK